MKIYCIGIGGIGLSALARYYVHEGHTVSGSDSSDSELIHTLQKEGMHISIGTDPSEITGDIDLVVYTVAISLDNALLMRARELGLTCMTYPEALGIVTKGKKTIAVCGTHGKTTTTAMVYYALKACGINPTVIIGSLLSEGGLNATGDNVASPDQAKLDVRTNYIAGDSDYMVVEACEYKRSFLALRPTHIIVTNIDEDHLDYYKDLSDIHSAFQSFADVLPHEGLLVTHSNVSLVTNARKIDADCISTKDIDLTVLGEHNKSNAQLVIALVKELGLDEEKARGDLKQFPGTWRRMEYKGKTGAGVMVYDDYGHHPTEIKATYEALRTAYPKGEYTIVMLFQPHLYSRTKLLFNDFVSVLSAVDHVYVLPIYRARLEDTSVTSEEELVSAITAAGGKADRLDSLSDISEFVESLTDTKTIVVNMGAGDAFAELDKVRFV